jgi:hypothetical protein
MPKDTTVLFNAWFVGIIPLPSVSYSHLSIRLLPSNLCVRDDRTMARDKELYPEPELFVPERFWGKMDSKAARQANSVFGFGRRVCPGKAFAESSIFLLMSNIVATMDLAKASDEAGNPITPNVEYEKSLVRYAGQATPPFVGNVHELYARHLLPFKCNLRYRSEKARSLVEQARLIHI